MPKDYVKTASDLSDKLGLYLRRVGRSQRRIAEINKTAYELSQELAGLKKYFEAHRGAYESGKLTEEQFKKAAEEFIRRMLPYQKQLRKFGEATKKEERVVGKERQTIDELVEKLAAVIILAIATFSLVTSILDNPSITGYTVLGISQATNATFILNLLAFVFVLLLVYPAGDIIKPIKATEVRKSRKALRKKRK